MYPCQSFFHIDVNFLFWAEPFVDAGGLDRVIDVAAEVPELKSESMMELTTNTRNLVSVLLSLVYDNLNYDAARNRYTEAVDNCLKYF